MYRDAQWWIPGATIIWRLLVLQKMPRRGLALCWHFSDSIFDPTVSHKRDCNSSTPHNPLAQFHPTQPSLTVLYTNCRSLSPKDQLRLLVSAHTPHLICVCETWLDENISDSELFIPSYCLVCHDRDRHGSGIAIYIQESIPFSILLKHPTVEAWTQTKKAKPCLCPSL